MWRKQELLGLFQITPDKWSSYPHIDNKNQSLKFLLLDISHDIHILYLLWTLQWKYWTNFIHECRATPCRPASPVLAHPGDGGKEPILNNKDINGLVDGGVLPVWKKVLEWHATMWQKTVRMWWQSPLLTPVCELTSEMLQQSWTLLAWPQLSSLVYLKLADRWSRDITLPKSFV